MYAAIVDQFDEYGWKVAEIILPQDEDDVSVQHEDGYVEMAARVEKSVQLGRYEQTVGDLRAGGAEEPEIVEEKMAGVDVADETMQQFQKN